MDFDFLSLGYYGLWHFLSQTSIKRRPPAPPEGDAFGFGGTAANAWRGSKSHEESSQGTRRDRFAWGTRRQGRFVPIRFVPTKSLECGGDEGPVVILDVDPTP